VSSSPYPWS